MQEFYTLVILLITRLSEFGEKQLLVFGLRGGGGGGRIGPLMQVALSYVIFFMKKQITCIFCRIDLSRRFTRYTWGWSFCYYQMDDPIRYIHGATVGKVTKTHKNITYKRAKSCSHILHITFNVTTKLVYYMNFNAFHNKQMSM